MAVSGTVEEIERRRQDLRDALDRLRDDGVPVSQLAEGSHGLYGGMRLMVECDLVVASDKAAFGTTKVRVGLWPMMITAEIVRNIGRKKALELMLLGDRISAEEAHRIGLVNRVVPQDDLEAGTMKLAGAQ